MSPETVHFLAQVIRQQRGMLTACEKWVRRQARTPEGSDLLVFVNRGREELAVFEAWLSQRETSQGNGQ
jgi:hypothetical protein